MNFEKYSELKRFEALNTKEQYDEIRTVEERTRNCPLNDNYEFDEQQIAVLENIRQNGLNWGLRGTGRRTRRHVRN